MSVTSFFRVSDWLRPAALVAGICISTTSVAAGKDSEEPFPSFQEKSTIETLGLTSLDSDGLADAVIGGALDAPAAGEEMEASGELRQRNNLSSEELLKDEFTIAPVPQASLPEIRLPQVTPTRSIYDVLDVTPR
ncbi:hypothetical protein [Hahella ganghwensis]|uniref:hypothetical protein n=1 Tax=Hahella ganghwensis TaxID=286420 RepID=UPI00037CB884|nr:hypothetical protein [Hahella ganghwensis]